MYRDPYAVIMCCVTEQIWPSCFDYFQLGYLYYDRYMLGHFDIRPLLSFGFFFA